MPDDLSRTVTFNLHDILGVRLVDASPSQLVSVTRQLGHAPAALTREPDIVIRFSDDLPTSGLTLLGLNSTAYRDDKFYVLDPTNGTVDAQIPFDTIGTGCDIVCRQGLLSIPLLPDIINLSFLARGFVALHGSAFRASGRNVLVAGWEKGGKTEALLAFAARGAEFIGDEMMVLSADGNMMFGIPIPISVWDCQFRYLDGLLPKISLGQKIQFRLIHMLDGFYRRFGSGRFSSSRPMAILRKALPSLKRQLRNWYRPDELFAGKLSPLTSGPDQVYLVASHDSAEIVVEPCSADDIAERMTSSNEYERSHVYQYYRAFRYAFPARRNAMLDALDAAQATALRKALAGKTAYSVRHPYPVELDALYAAMHPCVAGENANQD